MRRRAVLIVSVLALFVGVALLAKGAGELTGGGSSPRPDGQVIFGTAVDTAAFTVTGPTTSVKAGTLIGWVAYLSDSVNGNTMTVTFTRTTGSGEQTVNTQSVNIPNPGDDTLDHGPTSALTTLGPGDYTVRCIRPSDTKVLATGTLTVTP